MCRSVVVLRLEHQCVCVVRVVLIVVAVAVAVDGGIDSMFAGISLIRFPFDCLATETNGDADRYSFGLDTAR